MKNKFDIKKTTYLLLFSFFLTNISFADSLTVEPSPTLQSMQRFGNYNVNYSTGIPAIAIPLYTVKTGELEIPVTINCNTSGRRVGDCGSQLGVGWTLNTGGIITRTIKGYVDERFYATSSHGYSWLTYVDEDGKELGDTVWSSFFVYPYYTYEWITAFNDDAKGNWGSSLGRWENEFDIFRYSLPSGKSGSFIIHADENDSLVAMTIPYDPIKILLPIDEIKNLDWDNYSHYSITNFKIIDTDGTQYLFGKGVKEQIAVEESAHLWQNNDGNTNESRKKWREGNTGWYLCSIISSSKGDTINFYYEECAERQHFNERLHTITDVLNTTSYLYYDADANDPYYDHTTWSGGDDYDGITLVSAGQYNYILRKIAFKNGFLSFYNNVENIDSLFEVHTDWRCGYLDSIGIYDKNYNVIKKFVFEIENESDNNNYKLLKSIYNKNKNNKVVSSYNFEYYNNADASIIEPWNKDWWGFFNNSDNDHPFPVLDDPIERGRVYCSTDVGQDDSNVMTATVGTSTEYFGECDYCSNVPSNNCSKESNLDGTEQGVLKKIYYPTGGYTEFVYELNYVPEDNDAIDLGNCAGLRIKNIINNDGNGNTVKKQYEYSDGYMRDYFLPTKENIINESFVHKAYPCGGSCDDFDLVYAIDYRKLTLTGNLIYSPMFHSNIVEYYHIKEKTISNEVYNGYTDYYYDVPFYWDYYGEENLYDSLCDYSDLYPLLIDYEYGGSGKGCSFLSYDMDSDYGPFTKKYINVEQDWKEPLLRYIETYNKNDVLVAKKETDYGIFYMDKAYTNSVVRNINLSISASGVVPNYEEKRWYEEGKSRTAMGTSRIEYEIFSVGFNKYVSAAIKPTKIINWENGVKDTTEISYETEYLLPLTKRKTQSNGTNKITTYTYPFLYSSTESVYDSMVAQNMISPVIIKTDTIGESWEELQTNYYIFNGNVIKPQTVKTRSSLNSTYDTKLIYDNYDDYGNPLKFLNKSGIYTYYLWGYNNQYPVAKIESSIDNTIISTIIVDDEELSYTDDSNDIDNAIDNIQSLLSDYIDDNNYSVTIYTYKSLVGMTSSTNERGMTTYYEYDDFGRLSAIKNDDGDLLNEYEYHYTNE